MSEPLREAEHAYEADPTSINLDTLWRERKRRGLCDACGRTEEDSTRVCEGGTATMDTCVACIRSFAAAAAKILLNLPRGRFGAALPPGTRVFD